MCVLHVFLPRANLFVLWFLLAFLDYFLVFVLSCQYQCKYLHGKTHLLNDLCFVERDVKLYSPTHSFRLGKGTTNAIFTIRKMQSKHAFVGIVNAFDTV